MAKHNLTGKWGEQIAVDMLVAKGFDIVERNWRMNHLEIDIIARSGQRFMFVEVKTRTDKEYNDPLLLISKRKLQNMVRAANVFMNNYNSAFSAQFDIIIISGDKNNYNVDYYPDAYYPPMKTYR